MNIKVALAATALVAGIALAAPGMAMTASKIPSLKTAAEAQSSLVEKTHGWHRKCRRGLNGWHKHVRGVGRVQCTLAKNCYTNMFGFRVCNWF